MIHENSRKAYREETPFTSREEDVMRAFRELGPATDRKVKWYLQANDMNAVRPRITELIKRGELEECGRVRCDVTRRTVRLVRVAIQFPEAYSPSGVDQGHE